MKLFWRAASIVTLRLARVCITHNTDLGDKLSALYLNQLRQSSDRMKKEIETRDDKWFQKRAVREFEELSKSEAAVN